MLIGQTGRAARQRHGGPPVSAGVRSAVTGVRFWQSLFVYVWTASLLGTWYELVLSQVMTAVTGDSSWWRRY